MVQVNPTSSTFNVVANSINSTNSVVAGQPASYYALISRDWAVSSTIVQNTDYSSKYYAAKSKEYADSILTDAGFIAVSEDLTNIDLVAGSITDVNTLADITSDISATALISTDISTLADTDNLTAITTCSTNMSDINTCADNIAVITNKANISLDNLNSAGKARIAVKQYLITETFMENDIVIDIDSDNRVSMYRSLIDHNTGNPLSDTDSWEKINLGGGSKDIGDISMSITPKVNACEHLLDGALINGSGIYSDFVDYIADLTTDYPDLFVTESVWQTAVTTYGVCAKFVYDSVNNTVRLPKITGIVEGTTDLTALGDLIQAGLPNITGSLGVHWNIFAGKDGVFDLANQQTFTVGGSTTAETAWNTATFDASRSSSLYKNNFNKVQPQTIKVLFYICIATVAKTSIEVDIDEIATDLNGKADTDLTNTTAVGKALMANSAMPSGTYDDLTLGASGSTYTAPANGWIFLGLRNGNTDGWLILIGNHYRADANCYAGIMCGCYLPVYKGEVVSIYYHSSFVIGGADQYFRFIYAQGEV